MNTLAQDLDYALGTFRKSPGFVAATVATLALPALRGSRIDPLTSLRSE